MGNTYFQFKQFRVNQDQSAMKVCTDSCILGALANTTDATKILDIGTGTGVLALMLAQKSPAQIDAVEIEESAARQAEDNFRQSPWKNRLRIFPMSIQEYVKTSGTKYDIIVSNPPFFKDQLKSPDSKINIAHHSEALSFEELAYAVSKLMKAEGRFYLLLPHREFQLFASTARPFHIFPEKLTYIKDTEESQVFRVAGSFHRKELPCHEEQLVIKEKDGSYTPQFVALLKDYYLYL